MVTAEDVDSQGVGDEHYDERYVEGHDGSVEHEMLHRRDTCVINVDVRVIEEPCDRQRAADDNRDDPDRCYLEDRRRLRSVATVLHRVAQSEVAVNGEDAHVPDGRRAHEDIQRSPDHA